MKWWILAIIIGAGLIAWCYLRLTPQARRERAMFTHRDKSVSPSRLAREYQWPQEPLKEHPAGPKTANEYIDVVI